MSPTRPAECRPSGSVVTALVLLWSCSLASANGKLVSLGWDQPNTQRLRENLAQMEQQPLDGVMIGAEGQQPDGKVVALKRGFTADSWERAWFQSALDDLQAVEPGRLTDNFVMFGANPGNVDWFDDAGWANVVDHWRTAAWLAKQGGCKGLEFDPEPYSDPFSQFRYDAQPAKDQHTFAEYVAKARQRGREVMAAVAEEYPDITLFTLFMNSVNRTAVGRDRPERALARSGYGLYPAFIDGWLDAAPPTVTFVDGCESAYLFNSATQYLEAAVQIKGACQQLVSPENRAKYRAQVQVGFGIYLDAYWNPKESEWGRWYIDGLGGERVDRLRANVSTALRVADQYVWIYGEKYRWWPTPNQRVNAESWDQALPGCDRALRLARDPAEYARQRIAAGDLANQARNGDFGSDKAQSDQGAADDWVEGRSPAGWHSWQTEASQGAFTWDRETGRTAPGSARAAGVAEGCFIQTYEAKPGELWAVRVQRKHRGAGESWIRLRWQTADSRWIAETQDVIAYGEPVGAHWSEVLAVGEVPEEVGKLVVLLGVAGQAAADDVAWFDEVEVYRLD